MQQLQYLGKNKPLSTKEVRFVIHAAKMYLTAKSN